MNKKILKFIQETLLTTLLALILWAFIFSLILFITQKGYKNDIFIINLISFFGMMLMIIEIFSVNIHMYFLYIGFFNYKIEQLCRKHSISLTLENVSKKANFFWFYFLRGSISIILLVLINYSEFRLGKTKTLSRIEEILSIKKNIFLI